MAHELHAGMRDKLFGMNNKTWFEANKFGVKYRIIIKNMKVFISIRIEKSYHYLVYAIYLASFDGPCIAFCVPVSTGKTIPSQGVIMGKSFIIQWLNSNQTFRLWSWRRIFIRDTWSLDSVFLGTISFLAPGVSSIFLGGVSSRILNIDIINWSNF